MATTNKQGWTSLTVGEDIPIFYGMCKHCEQPVTSFTAWYVYPDGVAIHIGCERLANMDPPQKYQRGPLPPINA